MFRFRKSKKMIHLMIEDKLIRMVETNGNDIQSVKFFTEKVVPKGFIEHGKIVDEIGFYEYIKELVKELKIKNRPIQFNVPSPLVIMRQEEVPVELKEKQEILDYLKGELGRSIHLPFEEPIIDIPLIKPEYIMESETTQITFFAVPSEEVRKYAEVFIDASLRPESADVGVLGNYRYYHEMNAVYQHRVYLIVEFNRQSINLGIFLDDVIEFLRHQDLDVEVTPTQDEETNEVTWKYLDDEAYIRGIMYDQVSELERIMNFYQFSLHKGEKAVTDLILLGDNSYLEEVVEEMKKHFLDVKVTLLDNHTIEKNNQKINRAYIPALGLALKGGM